MAYIQMGYDFGVYLPGGWQTVPQAQVSGAEVVYSNVDCTGYETSIWECSMDEDVNSADCDVFQNSVAVYCSRFC